jgi:transcriptional regulator with XRE-family HTH domain
MTSISDQLRAAVEARIERGWTVYRVAKEAGITPAMLSRFLKDGLDLRLSTAAKLAAALGLELRPKKKHT